MFEMNENKKTEEKLAFIFFRFTQYLQYQTQFFISDIHGHVNAILGASVEIRLFLHDF